MSVLVDTVEAMVGTDETGITASPVQLCQARRSWLPASSAWLLTKQDGDPDLEQRGFQRIAGQLFQVSIGLLQRLYEIGRTSLRFGSE